MNIENQTVDWSHYANTVSYTHLGRYCRGKNLTTSSIWKSLIIVKRTVAVAIVRFAYGVILMTIEQVIDNVKRLKRDYAVSDEQIIADINKVEMLSLIHISEMTVTALCVGISLFLLRRVKVNESLSV